MRHSWRPFSAKWLPEIECYERIRRCSRCKTKKKQVIAPGGGVVSSQYDYPDGYQTEGMGRLAGDSLDALRLVSLYREIGDPYGNGNGNGTTRRKKK